MLSAPLLDALSVAGAHDEVLSQAGPCLALPFSICAADLLRLQGEAHLASGAPADAEASLRAAIDTAQRQGASTYELRATVRYGQWLTERGDRDEAVRLGAAASDRLESGMGPAEASSARSAPGALRAAHELLAVWVSDGPGLSVAMSSSPLAAS